MGHRADLATFTCAVRLLQRVLLAALLVAMTVPKGSVFAATSMTEQPYYAYILYLRSEPKRNLVAEAEAIAQPLLKRHRLVDAAAGVAWDRTGQPPISFEQRSAPQARYDEMKTDDGELFAELFHLPFVDRLLKGRTTQPISELVMRIGPPSRLDIKAYVEGVEIALAVAKKLNAMVILDEETAQRQNRREWELERRRCQGQQGQHPAPVISEQNPPWLGLSGHVMHDFFERGWHTRGMRKFGLPDLVLEDYCTGFNLHTVIEIVSNLLVSGHRPHEQTGDLVIRADDPALKKVMNGNPNGKSTVRLVSAQPFDSQPQGRILAISFDAQEHATLYERQMQLHVDLLRDRTGLSSDERRSLGLAIGACE